eukprot:5227867-Amphidinium_carterae.6
MDEPSYLEAWTGESGERSLYTLCIKIPEGTPRSLGAPAKGHGWSEEAVLKGFKSETGLTPNMFQWVIARS